MTGHTDLRTLDRPFLVDKVVMNRTYHELSLYKCIANINYFEAVASIQRERDIYIYIGHYLSRQPQLFSMFSQAQVLGKMTSHIYTLANHSRVGVVPLPGTPL